MNNPQNPEILAFALLPSSVERRRRELMLVRLMLLATEPRVVSGEGIGLQSARDLVFEILHCYPELTAEWGAR